MSSAPIQTSPEMETRASEASGAALVFREVRKSFQERNRRVDALKGVSFQTESGRVTGLIGPDGAGKTTLMRLAAGLLHPDSGSIEVLGTDVVRDPLRVQSTIGYMPQRFGLYEDLSVQENLNLYADLQGVPPGQREERYRELMTMTGLGDFTGRLAGRLSGGMKQKLGLACTLVRAPRLLLLDEPTVGVDPVSRRELWAIVARLVRDEGMSVLLSTAYLDEAERCHDVILLHEGCVLDQAPPAEYRSKQEGRTWIVQAPELKKRTVQERLSGKKGVVDSVIQGDHVRLVTEGASRPDAAGLLGHDGPCTVNPVPPRFEDCYIALLKSQGDAEGGSGDDGDGEGQGSGAGIKPSGGGGSSNGKPVITTENLSRRFGSFYAVNRISFDVRRGEVFGLLGANGAGKSTTFRMLCGLLPVSGGTVRVAGKDLRHAAAAARGRIGYMSQKFSLYAGLTVRENMRFFSSAYNLKGRRREERIDWALEQFQLRPLADSTSGMLPLGFKQRLALGCALMHEPEILFLDEPTSGVDPLARREFWHHINGLAEQGVTVLVTTHFMEEAEYCDRLAIMVAGEILALGPPSEIKQRARSASHPDPTMEDAFIHLIESRQDDAGKDAGT